MAADLTGQDREAALVRLAATVRACRICRDAPEGMPLAHEPRPVLRPSVTARLCIASQAPGTRVHASGVPFTDPSGDRLRSWLGIGRDIFYDTARVAILPMGFCFPGQSAGGSDLPPRRECAAHWHDRLFAHMPQIELVLAIGGYAQAYHLGELLRPSLTETVADWRQIMTATAAEGRTVLPLPHPSWRNNGWIKRNAWFEAELVPVLRAAVAQLTAAG